MKAIHISVAAGLAAAMLAAPAVAADLPPPMIYKAAPVVQEFSGWYLRGDIGMTNQKVKELDYFRFATTPGFAWLDKGGFDAGLMVGIGAGYRFNDWFRMDVTGEYRGKTDFRALDRYDGPFSNEYTGVKSEWLFLANAYLDLGTWWCITPFVGAGFGVVNINIEHFRDTNVIAGGGGFADSGSTTNFAWALHAGLAYQVNKNFAVEFAYRYLNLGDGVTGTFYNLNGATANQVVTFKDITSHDFKLALRWSLGDFETGPAFVQPAYAPPPAVYSQPPVYSPAPLAPPPPLMRRG